MSEMKHTPGAMRAAAAICEHYFVEHRRFTQQHKSVKLTKLATLIDEQTAAPELLAALKEVLRLLEKYGLKDYVYEILKTAITKGGVPMRPYATEVKCPKWRN